MITKPSIAAIVEHGTSRRNKTGDWRFFKPVLNIELCNGCGICYLFCPDSSIIREDKKYRIIYDYCKGCGICAEECPKRAIKMVFEEK